MKLKNQFVIFIAATILMPFFCISGIFVYSCLNNPERTILKDFYNAKETEDYGLSPESWETLKDIIEKRPPRARTAVIINHNKILFSDIPELSTGETISDRHFLRRMEITSKDYFFQFIPASLDKNENQALIITRLPRKSESKRARYNRFILTVVFTLSFFSLFTIAFIIVISTTISRSIEILEKNTERIANGELDVELKIPRTKGHKNEITSLTENLEKMRQTLKENEERRTRFIMGISHDLRTPVAVIKGYTEALSDGTLDNPELKKNALEIIGTKTSQLESMIETLINYVKLNSSEWREQLVSQPIEKAIKEFAETAAVTGKLFKRKITTSIQIPENICIPFNRQLFNRALENIFSNAIRYSRDGDLISISAFVKESIDGSKSIKTGKNEHNETSIVISIADTGIGISEKDRQHIFDLFYKASNSRQEGGMGIGLAVVKNIIDAHQWKITVEENKDAASGTVFAIKIPVEE